MTQDETIAADLAQMSNERWRRTSARASAMARVVNDCDRSRFLVAYAGDLIHDGLALWEYRDEPRLVWVLRDMGTHIHAADGYAESTLKVWGDNSERVQWYRLEEEFVKEWVGQDRWEAKWVPCTGQEALAYLRGGR